MIKKQAQKTRESFGLDLRLIRSFNGSANQDGLRRPRTIHQLSALLKSKANRPQSHTTAEVERGRQWLQGKGINLQPLVAKISELGKKASIEKAGKAQLSQFQVDLNQRPIEEYLSKAEQYASLNLMQYIMSKSQRPKKQIYKFMERILEEGTTTFCSIQRQGTPEERDSYLEITKKVVSTQKEAIHISKQMLQQFKSKFQNAEHNSLWEVIGCQLKDYRRENSLQQNTSVMLLASLKLIHREFQRKLHGKDFDRYVNAQYLTKNYSKYIERTTLLWPKVWVAYCAGQTNRVKKLLSSDKRDHRQLIQLYQQSQKEIAAGTVVKRSFTPRYNILDIFYQQFVSCITGQYRFPKSDVANPSGLELVLMTVRTLGVFPFEIRSFREVRDNIVRKYRDSIPNEQVLQNILYLQDYDSLLKMGPNYLMSRQDYLHFLIVTAGFPGTITDASHKKALVQHLLNYINYLITERKTEYIYYIQLLPELEQIQNVAATVLSVDALDTFDWVGLRGLMQKQEFERIVLSTVELYRNRYGAQLRFAYKLTQLCNHYIGAFNQLLAVCISYYLAKSKISKEDALRAEIEGLQWSYQEETQELDITANQQSMKANQNAMVPQARQTLTSRGLPRLLQKAYHILFQLIGSYRQLFGLIMQRDELRLRQFIAVCSIIRVDLDGSGSLYVTVFRILQESRGLELYYNFLRMVIKAGEIYAVSIGDNQRLAVLKTVLRKQIEYISKMQFMNLEGYNLKRLRQELSVEL